ncbi:hypothetical protein GGR54DRAFT_267571 [Hypoxylon sp. NC1633]|nr:hypothetical protein GGR54DRAFT_267571 [Hypoxylon sp. NC1633]
MDTYKYLHENNISWLMIPTAFVLALLPRIWNGTTTAALHYDPRYPRRYLRALRRVETAKAAGDPTAKTAAQVLADRVERSEAALNNAMENLPLFAAAVVAANVEGLDTWNLNIASISYILVRILYTWVYIIGQEYTWLPGITRTLVWLSANGIIFYLFLAGATKLPPAPVLPSTAEIPDPFETDYSYWITEAKIVRREQPEGVM